MAEGAARTAAPIVIPVTAIVRKMRFMPFLTLVCRSAPQGAPLRIQSSRTRPAKNPSDGEAEIKIKAAKLALAKAFPMCV
ncbi:hypothetical protein GCM10010187_29660 [Actinomadura coerulea]|nr:hypothetical protein GCM10010187_29660 [Actinomadura coerulea]